MVTMQAPKGTTQVSVEQQNFTIDDYGKINVPEPFVETLKDIGFRIVPARITVSAEAAEAIAAAAKKLNLPVPQELQVEKNPAAAATDATGNKPTISQVGLEQQNF